MTPGTRTRRPAASFVAALVSLLMAAADAEAASRVAIAEPDDATLREATARLRGELTAGGFEVVPASGTGDDVAPDASADGFATLKLARDAGDVRVWVTDRVTGKTVSRRLAPGVKNPRAIAIRAVELLRASLLEIASPPPPPPEDDVPPAPAPAAPPDVTAWVAAAAPTLDVPGPTPLVPRAGVAAGVALVASVDHLGVAWMPTLEGWLAVDRHVTLRATVAGPGTSGGVANAAGSAVLRQELATIEITLAPVTASHVWPMASLGAGVHHLHVEGTAIPPYHDASDDVWAALVDGGAGVAAALGGHARVVLDGRALLTAPRAAVTIGGTRVGSVGGPSILGSLRLMADF